MNRIKIHHRLGVKLIASISFILILILSFHTFLLVKNLKNSLTYSNYQNAYNISDIIKKSIRYSMLLNRREDVHQIIQTIGTEKGVEGIRIYNKHGVIVFSTDSTEINKQVDFTTEACIVCHSQSTPLTRIPNQNKMRIFKDNSNNKVLGVINPIYNEPDCSNAECHAHSSDQEILGVLDIMVSLKGLDQIISENTKATINDAILITIVIAFFTGLFITILFNKPTKKLLKGIDEVGKGNLNYKIPFNSKDELGLVATRFNEMAGRLEAAYKEIEDWSENLSKKVEEKSEELKKIYEQVIQIEKLASLGKLSATVAHELNNPLEGILTYSKFIQKKLKQNQTSNEFENLIQYLDLISEESSRCGKIVKDMLLFSQKGDDEYQNINIIPIFERCILLISHHLEIHKISLQKEFESNEVIISCNPQKIQQAIMAMLINAIEAMPNGGNILIKTNTEKEKFICRIKDEGIGITNEALPHIFEPFFTTKESSKGTGLGLSIVYGIIKSHNGFVEVENTSPEGTTFKMTLPLNTKIS